MISLLWETLTPKLHGNEVIQMSLFFPFFFMLNSNRPDDGISRVLRMRLSS